jgi:hypothetical protein
MVTDRGWIKPEALVVFLKAGYTQANVLDAVLGVSMKVLSNYANPIAETPLDDTFAAEQWKVPKPG